jgi:hypothetical protein
MLVKIDSSIASRRPCPETLIISITRRERDTQLETHLLVPAKLKKLTVLGGLL